MRSSIGGSSSSSSHRQSFGGKDYLAQGYKRGSIARVAMLNFLTYDECEVFPGPKLNVVIGPNGTGKSTMTHAICLACAGTPSDIGRAADLGSFVKRGKEDQECFVEVDLVLDQYRTATIRRYLYASNNTSKWVLNGAPSTMKDVRMMVNSLYIDVDNLCSFMPQDKVGSFSRYSAEEVLQNTLKCVPVNLFNPDVVLEGEDANRSLYDEQMALSDIEKLKEDKRRLKESRQARFEDTEKQLDALKSELERLERRERAIKLKEFYEIKLLQVESDAVRVEMERAQESLQEANQRLQEEQKKIQPLEHELRDLEREQSKQAKVDELHRKQYESNSNSVAKAKAGVDDEDLAVGTASDELEAILVERRAKEERFAKLSNDHVRACKALEDAIEAAKQSEVQLKNIETQQQELGRQYEAIRDKSDQEQRALDPLRDNKENLLRTLRNIQDPREVYKNKLRASNQHVVSAMEWLDKNEAECRSTGKLRGEVLGPVCMLCSVSDPACAVMLERVIPQEKMMGFVVDNDADANFLKRELRERCKLPVNIYTIKNSGRDQRSPYSMALMNNLKSVGIEGYLGEQVKCPALIRAFLNTFQGLYSILWGRGSDTIGANVISAVCPDGVTQFRLFMHDPQGGGGSQGFRGVVTEYSGRRSRYNPGAAPSTVTTSILPKHLITNLADEGVHSQRAQLQQQIAAIEAEMQSKQQRIAQLREQSDEINVQIHALRTNRTSLQQTRKAPDAINSKKINLESQMRELEKQLRKGAAEERTTKMNLFVDSVDSLLSATKSLLAHTEQLSKQRAFRAFPNHLRKVLSVKIQAKEDELREAKAQLHQLQEGVREAQREKDRIARQIEQKDRELEEIVARYGNDLDWFIEHIFPKVIEACPEETKEDLTQRIVELRAEIRNTAENPQLQTRYLQLQEQAKTLKLELDAATADYREQEEGLRARADEWLDSVRKLSSRLNLSFGKYMEELRFEGEVLLRETGRFSEYELQLRVSFRNTSDLTDLSGTRQSGGERAVSTLMFLMALQEMTSSPFRVVDEINQGMDDRNERLVVDRIVQSCCTNVELKPQYFLVTPKLLQGLRSLQNEHVTILLVWNGPGVLSKWKFSAVLSKRLRQHEDHTAGESANEEENLAPNKVMAGQFPKKLKQERITMSSSKPLRA